MLHTGLNNTELSLTNVFACVSYTPPSVPWSWVLSKGALMTRRLVPALLIASF